MGKPTGFMEYKREECLSEAPLKRIKHFKEFHIHDGKENTCHLALGEGNINIKYFKDLAIKNDAYVVLEVKQKVDLLKSVPFFKSL